MNSVVSEVFSTAYLYKTCRPGLTHVAPVSRMQPISVSLSQQPTKLQYQMTSRKTATLVPTSVSDSSIADGDCCTVPPLMNGNGLGSISSITDSVNSWSFGVPGSAALRSSSPPSSCEPPAVETRHESADCESTDAKARLQHTTVADDVRQIRCKPFHVELP